MNVLIVGCGKLGSGLANSLYKKGHDVAVIDSDKESFYRLDENFAGFVVPGVPIDRETLEKGGIEACDFLVAVTDDDNVNVMVSQLAKEFYNVPKVLTRIYDPLRKNVFKQFGLHTISPTALTVDIIEQVINGKSIEEANQVTFGDTTLSIDSIKVPKSYYGVALCDVDHDSTETIIGIQQEQGTVLLRDMNINYELKQGDKIIFAKTV